MGLICNQVKGTLKDEVINEEKQSTSTPSSNTPKEAKRKRKLVKPRNFIYNLFKWYFKSRASLHDELSQSASSDALNCNEDDSSLAYRQHKNPHQTRTSSAKAWAKASQAPSSSSSNLSHSHYLVRQSICLYAASSVILALCYLATPSSAAETASHPV